jgi:hypothetical protein
MINTTIFAGVQKFTYGYWGQKFYLAEVSQGTPARTSFLRRKCRTATDAANYGRRVVARYGRMFNRALEQAA